MRALPLLLNAAAACLIVFSACWLRFERSQSKNTMNDGGATARGGGGRGGGRGGRGRGSGAELQLQTQHHAEVVVGPLLAVHRRVRRAVVAAIEVHAEIRVDDPAQADDALVGEHRAAQRGGGA